jgi:hypothetical protein
MLVRHTAGIIQSICLLSPRSLLLLLLLLLSLLFVITFTQCIYNYIPETNHASRVYNATATLQLQYMLLYSYSTMLLVLLLPELNVLYFYITTFRSTCAVPIVQDIFWKILKGFQLPLLLLVSLLHPTLTCLLFLSPSFALIFILSLCYLCTNAVSVIGH